MTTEVARLRSQINYGVICLNCTYYLFLRSCLITLRIIMVTEIPKTKLLSGQYMPIIGLGTYARKAEPGQYRQAVQWGIEAGYRHIDTASSYHNETEVGDAISTKIKDGTVTRDQLFVTTKLWNHQHSQKDVVPALKQSLAKLNMDYVNLYLIHWPVAVNEKGEGIAIDLKETWKGMEETVKLGLAKAIGVSNFNEEQLSYIIQSCTIKPDVNQFEINPTLTQHKLVEFCKQQGVVPVAYTPLGLISEARPEFIGKDVIKTDPKLGEIASKYGKTRAQIALKYLLQRDVSILPKSFTKSRIHENMDLFDFNLSDEELAVVDSYNINHRCVPGLPYRTFPNYPF